MKAVGQCGGHEDACGCTDTMLLTEYMVLPTEGIVCAIDPSHENGDKSRLRRTEYRVPRTSKTVMYRCTHGLDQGSDGWLMARKAEYESGRLPQTGASPRSSTKYLLVEKTLVHNGNLFMWKFLFRYCTIRRF